MKHKNIFHLIAHILEKEKVSCVLIGGFAVNHYKVSRQTADIDILTTQESYEKVLPRFKEEGYRVKYHEKIFARLTNQRYPLMDVDFLFVDARTLLTMVKEGTKVDVGGKKFVVPSLNHLIALKLHFLKQNSSMREFKDLMDILQLVKMNDVNIKAKGFRHICTTYGSEAIYRKISNLLK